MRNLILVFVAVATLAGVWLLTRSTPTTPTAVPRATEQPLSATDAPAPRSATTPSIEPAPESRTSVPTAVTGDAAIGPDNAQSAAEPGPTLTVLVRDHHGAPRAGVAIRLGARHDGRLAGRWEGRTDEAGQVAIPHVHAEFRKVFRSAGLDEVEGVVAVAAPFREPVQATFRADAVPTTPIELTLPPFGTVRVVAEHPDATVPIEGTANLELRNEATPAEPYIRFAQEPLRERTALFPVVGLDLDLRATVGRAGSSSSRSLDFHGPVAPDQEVLVRVPVLGAEPVLVARLVTPARNPLANEHLQFELAATSGSSMSSNSSGVRTNDDGMVFLTLSDRMPRDAERTMTLSAITKGLMLKMPLPRPIRDGDNDLGELVMLPPPLLVGGHVVDDVGVALADVRITVKGRDADSTWWQDVDAGLPKSDTEGAFEARGISDAVLLRVSASAPGYLDTDPLEVPPGTAEVVLRMRRGGSLEGRLLLPELPTDVMSEVVATPLDGNTATSLDVRGDRFEFPSLAPGRFDLSVTLFGQHLPCATMRGISIESGERTKLEPIDLRGVLRAVSIRVVDAGGQPIPESSALVLAPRDPASTAGDVGGAYLEEGRGVVVTTRDPLDLLVFAAGFMRTRVNDVQDGQTIVLAPALGVQITAPIDALPVAPRSLRVELKPIDTEFTTNDRYHLRSPSSSHSMSGSLPWANDLDAVFDANGVATLRVPTPGTYRVQWSLTGGPDGVKVLYTTKGAIERIDVAAEAAPQTFASGITREILDRAAGN